MQFSQTQIPARSAQSNCIPPFLPRWTRCSCAHANSLVVLAWALFRGAGAVRIYAGQSDRCSYIAPSTLIRWFSTKMSQMQFQELIFCSSRAASWSTPRAHTHCSRTIQRLIDASFVSIRIITSAILSTPCGTVNTIGGPIYYRRRVHAVPVDPRPRARCAIVLALRPVECYASIFAHARRAAHLHLARACQSPSRPRVGAAPRLGRGADIR